jgi:hypothetical protein
MFNYRNSINLAILQLREEGTLEEIKIKWWVNRSECEDSTNQAKPIVYFILFSLIYG